MKSLEIIKDLIWETQKKYDYVDLKQDKTQLEDEIEKINSKFNKLQQIKADLDILEIIRKKQVNISYLKQYFEDKRFTLKDIHYLTTLHNMYLTMEELLKLKQWLEGNENE